MRPDGRTITGSGLDDMRILVVEDDREAAGYLVKPLSARSLKRAVAAIICPIKRGRYAISKSESYRRR